MSFIAELKRRNVFRVGIAYAVTSWLLMQAADLIFPRLGLEDSAVTLVIVLLAIGFIPALIFAWAFELTPEGIKKERDVDRSQSITHTTGRKLDFTIIGILVLALGYFAYDKFVLTPAQHAEQAAAAESTNQSKPAEREKSIAVLPFVNMSDDSGNEFFSDGISEEILNSLAKVKELKVAGRTSSFAFKGQNADLRKIGETLGVENILEGSVRKFGDQVRITAQLIQVEDGFHLWSESYDRTLENVFAIQDEIATAILNELKATLLEGEAEALVATRTDSKAYELYLLAKQRMYERTRLTLESAAQLLDEAIAIDPEYAPAYAQRGIAQLLLSVTSYGNIPQQDALAQARIYLDRALSLDENQAEALAGLGLYYSGPPNQPDKSIPLLEKALAINPGLNNAGNWLAMSYWNVNRVNDALALLESINARDPLYRPAIGNRLFTLLTLGRSEEAEVYINSVAPFMPGDPNIKSNLAWIKQETGETAEALKLMQECLELQPTDRVYRVGVNQGNYNTHQFDRVFDDEWSDAPIWALFNLGRIEEATRMVRKRAEDGTVDVLFSFLNASDQSETLVRYFEDHWPDFESFVETHPAPMAGYRVMADIALAYQRTGNPARFEQAMALLHAANRESLTEGVKINSLRMMVAAHHAMAGEHDQALNWLAQSIDGGFVTSSRISSEFPYFRELEGDPEYEAIQGRMIQNINRERALLGLQPVST